MGIKYMIYDLPRYFYHILSCSPHYFYDKRYGKERRICILILDYYRVEKIAG